MKKLLLLSVCVLFFVNLKASHILGGDCNYKRTADSLFINLNWFSDCNAITTLNYRSPIYYYVICRKVNCTSSNSKPIMSDTNFTEFKDISPVCNGISSKCTPGSTYPFGFKKESYFFKINLNDTFFNSCC